MHVLGGSSALCLDDRGGIAVTQPLWYIADRAYDLTAWFSKHPGGADPLQQAEGTNCTELFRSYHLRGMPVATMLARYEVPVDRDDPEHAEKLRGSHFTFDDDDFYKVVQARVRAYFKDNHLETQATPLAQVVAVLLILTSVALVVPAYMYGSITAALALAIVKTLGAIGPGHTMSHFALFGRGRWNILIFRLFSPFLVSNPAIWSASHIQSHHVRTLTKDDLQDNYPLKRVQPLLAHRAWHRGQHVYMWLIYMLGLPLWAMQDFVRSGISIFSGTHANIRFSLAQRIENTVIIGMNLFITVVLPFLFLDWQRALLVCLLANVPASLMLVVQIAVNHEVPETMSNVVPGEAIDWGAHQVLTSHNFGVDSTIALHMSGGLNMQIEHHLFPGVHYRHYPAISKLVREACVEFGLPYHTSRSVFEAVSKHYDVLKINSVPSSVLSVLGVE